MTYLIRPQGDSYLVIEASPESPKRHQAERIVAVCGTMADASRVMAGLIAIRPCPVIGASPLALAIN